MPDYNEIAKELLITYLEKNNIKEISGNDIREKKLDEYKFTAQVIAEMYNELVDKITRENKQ
ncbi:MAG: hypothetical protein WC364_04740 [Eubacteriales bacterium]